MAKLSVSERITMLEEAQEKIAEAVDLLKAATRGDEYTHRTMIADLEIMIGQGGWLSADATIGSLIDGIREEDGDEDGAEERDFAYAEE